MGFAKTLGRNLSRRCFQYAVRSTYPMFEKPKKSYGYDYDVKPKKPKYTPPPCDKNGVSYCEQSKAIFQNKEYVIDRVEGKMVWLSDGKRHRMSSCILC